MTAWVWVAVAGVGGAGAIARFLLDGAITRRSMTGFPLGTFVVNVSGSALLGFLMGLSLSSSAMVIAGTAAVGSYTTFSTWMLETHRLAQDAESLSAFVNIVASLALGIGAALLGHVVGAGM